MQKNPNERQMLHDVKGELRKKRTIVGCRRGH